MKRIPVYLNEKEIRALLKLARDNVYDIDDAFEIELETRLSQELATFEIPPAFEQQLETLLNETEEKA